MTEVWSKRLARLSKRLDENYSDPNDGNQIFAEEEECPQPGAVELGKWLLLTRFLNRGGEE
jgi:hypothetical protein